MQICFSCGCIAASGLIVLNIYKMFNEALTKANTVAQKEPESRRYGEIGISGRR